MKKIQQYLDVVSRSLGPNYFLLLMEDLHLHIDRRTEFLYLYLLTTLMEHFFEEKFSIKALVKYKTYVNTLS